MTEFFIIAAIMTGVCIIATFRGAHDSFMTLRLAAVFYAFWIIAMLS